MLYVPPSVTVGFQSLPSSFTGKKGFITYRELGNKEDKLFNQSKYDAFIDGKNKEITIDNNPISGFVVNKKMTHDHSYFGQINTVLIYHPDGFEFEISLWNLMMIMEHSDINSQEIKQECILGWYKNYPILVPTNSKIYTQAIADNSVLLEVTDMNKDLVVGRTYYSKTEKNLVYIGKREILKLKSFKQPEVINSRKGHIFLKNNREFVSLAKCQAAYSDQIHPNLNHFIKMYEIQQAEAKINMDEIFIKRIPSMMIYNKIQQEISERFDNYHQNLKYIQESNYKPYISEKEALNNFVFGILQEIERNVFSFCIYSHEQKKPYEFTFGRSLINEEEMKFSTAYSISKKIIDDSFYSNSRSIPALDNDLNAKLLKEFKIVNLINDIIDFSKKYLADPFIDTTPMMDIIEKFLSKIDLVGIHYAADNDLEYATLYSRSHYLSKYDKFSIDGLNIVFNDVEKMDTISNIIYEKDKAITISKLK